MKKENKVKLSIITSGKNDNYAGNFLQRLQHNLSKLNDNIEKSNINDVEIIVVDWGSEEKLSDALNISNLKFTKFIYITNDVADRYSPESKFSVALSLNAGYRRCQGEYILFVDGDSYIPFESFINLYKLIQSQKDNSNIFYWASRYHLPYEIHSSISNTEELDTHVNIWLQNNKEQWRHDKVNLGNFMGAAMGLLLSKNICEESTLFWEELNRWGWIDIELHSRISNKYPCCGDLEDLDMYFFHLDHHNIASGGLNGSNPCICPPNFNANNDNWGLINENLELYTK